MKNVPPNSQRYYYPSKELIDSEYRSEILCADTLHRLNEKENERYTLVVELSKTDVEKVEASCPLEKYALSGTIFEKVVVRQEDKEYSDRSLGVPYCYLPSVIECYDKDAMITFFVALVEGRCEVCSNTMHLGRSDTANYVPWYESVGRYGSISDPEIIRKIESSILAKEVQLDEVIRRYHLLIQRYQQEKEAKLATNQARLMPLSKELEGLFSMIGVSSATWKTLFKKIVAEEDPIAELLDLLHNRDYIAYLDWKDDMEETVFALNQVLKKQKKKRIDEDLGAERELYCEEAVAFIAGRVDEDSLISIDTGSDGIYVTVVRNEEADEFVLKWEYLFRALEEEHFVKKFR